jgi:aminopeptidase N
MINRAMSLFALVCGFTAAPVIGAEPVTSGQFDVLRYTLALSPDPAGKSVAGTEDIVFRKLGKDLRRIVFSPNALTIDSASVDGKRAPISRSSTELAFDLPAVLGQAKTATLHVLYHGVPARGIASTPSGLYTSYFACDWMICSQDTPGDKAILELSLRVPKGMTTIAAGRRISVKPASDETEIHRWRMERPYSAYLYGFATGRYARVVERVDGAEIVYLSDVATEAELRPLFDQTPDMVRFLGDKAGIALPAESYMQLLVPGDEAQEAATYSVIGKDEIAPVLADPVADWVIVHELAHQWWGNAVTCASWRDFWLNEGITTFMTAAWKEHRFGRAAYDAELDIARQRVAKVREKGYDEPLAYAGEYPTLGMRRAVQYSKGALFMDHLRTVLGDKAFWAGLRGYTRAHAGGTATSIDFERAMEKASGRDLRDVFAEWVFG